MTLLTLLLLKRKGKKQGYIGGTSTRGLNWKMHKQRCFDEEQEELTVPRISVEHLLYKPHLALPCHTLPFRARSRVESFLLPFLRGWNERDVLKTPSPMVPYPIHLGVLLECRKRKFEIVQEEFMNRRCGAAYLFMPYHVARRRRGSRFGKYPTKKDPSSVVPRRVKLWIPHKHLRRQIECSRRILSSFVLSLHPPHQPPESHITLANSFIAHLGQNRTGQCEIGLDLDGFLGFSFSKDLGRGFGCSADVMLDTMGCALVWGWMNIGYGGYHLEEQSGGRWA